MTPAEVLEFSTYWYGQGVCPGCDASLVDVAGQGDVHSKLSGRYRHAGPISGDSCAWKADDLTSLVLIGSGVVKVR